MKHFIPTFSGLQPTCAWVSRHDTHSDPAEDEILEDTLPVSTLPRNAQLYVPKIPNVRQTYRWLCVTRAYGQESIGQSHHSSPFPSPPLPFQHFACSLGSALLTVNRLNSNTIQLWFGKLCNFGTQTKKRLKL